MWRLHPCNKEGSITNPHVQIFAGNRVLSECFCIAPGRPMACWQKATRLPESNLHMAVIISERVNQFRESVSNRTGKRDICSR